MPLRSMTGFGQGGTQNERFRAAASVRSLNHRHLEVRVSLNEPFEALEPEARARVERAFSRGKVDAALRIESLEGAPTQLRVSAPLVKAWLQEVNELRKALGVRERVPFAEALRVPGAVEVMPCEIALREEDKSVILAALDGALEGALSMKRAEGQALAREFSTHLDALEQNVDAIGARADDMVAAHAQKLSDRLREWSEAGNFQADDERILREAALYAERSDIAEEVARLRSHLGQFRTLLDSEERDAGRALDFLLQEMHREANTLSVKARFDNLMPIVLQLRTGIERLREQARNIE